MNSIESLDDKCSEHIEEKVLKVLKVLKGMF